MIGCVRNVYFKIFYRDGNFAGNLPYRLDELPTGSGSSINTVAAGNPPLWVTRVASNQVFINNARISPELTFTSNYPDSSKRKVSKSVARCAVQCAVHLAVSHVYLLPTYYSYLGLALGTRILDVIKRTGTRYASSM